MHRDATPVLAAVAASMALGLVAVVSAGSREGGREPESAPVPQLLVPADTVDPEESPSGGADQVDPRPLRAR